MDERDVNDIKAFLRVYAEICDELGIEPLCPSELAELVAPLIDYDVGHGGLH